MQKYQQMWERYCPVDLSAFSILWLQVQIPGTDHNTSAFCFILYHSHFLALICEENKSFQKEVHIFKNDNNSIVDTVASVTHLRQFLNGSLTVLHDDAGASFRASPTDISIWQIFPETNWMLRS